MVIYKGMQLATNSDAYKMWQEKKFDKLDKHLKELERKEAELIKRYTKHEEGGGSQGS